MSDWVLCSGLVIVKQDLITGSIWSGKKFPDFRMETFRFRWS
ncbi:hypothetical protein LEP1GSC192_0251 [Leptospira sp. B5-022]|nr:hypothetical protein LEP1GSC192_0251 [Leptospira sp. B5-022]